MEQLLRSQSIVMETSGWLTMEALSIEDKDLLANGSLFQVKMALILLHEMVKSSLTVEIRMLIKVDQFQRAIKSQELVLSK